MPRRKQGRSMRNRKRGENHVDDVTTSIIRRPPEDPPNRQRGGRWRRVVQAYVGTGNSADTNVGTAHFFDASFNTSGFTHLFLHRITVWSNLTSSTSVSSTISAVLLYHVAPFVRAGPTYRDATSQDNRRSVVAFNVPSHLSGPRANGQDFLTVNGDSQYLIEIDATFV